MSDQSPIDYADNLWRTLEKTYPFLRSENLDIQEKRKQLQRKEVIISAFGRHNCGKSTLLNFIIRNECLPTSEDNETCIEIKIRHDRTVHPGSCNNSCRGNCPWLEQEGAVSNSVVARGREAIAEWLHKENDQKRCQTNNSDDRQGKRHCFVLYAFVPILQEAPEGWSLALVDTPGFGEANVEHIMKHTDMLFSTSTAYLYLMDATSMDDKVDSDNFKLLFQHDKDIFQDGRLIVAVNKYDIRLSQQTVRHSRNQRSQSRQPQLSVTSSLSSLQRSTGSIIAKTIESHPPPCVEIVPVSAHWGESAQWLRADPDSEYDKKQARRIIEDYPDSLPQGQGGGDMTPQEMAITLERMSGLPTLEEKLREMIKKCIHIWRTSLTNAYAGYLRKAMASLSNHREELQREQQRIDAQMALVEKYNADKRTITGLAYCEDGEKAEIETRLEEKYVEVDIEAAKRLLHGRIEDMVEKLILVMKSNVERARKPFLPRDFEQEVKKFLEEEAEKTLNEEQLNMKLEGVAAGFRESLGEMEDLDREIEQTARQILPPDWTPQSDDLRRERANRGNKEEVLTDEVLQNQQLTLKDLHERTKAPEIKIGFFKKIWNSIRKMFGKKVEEQAYEKWTPEMDGAISGLKSELTATVDSYITDTLKKWVIEEVFSPAYRNRVKCRCQALLGTFEPAIAKEKAKLDEDKRNCATDSDMEALEADIQQIQDALASLN